jgi:putative oxidoreductase
MTDVADPAPPSPSIPAWVVDRLTALCALVPYALVALWLRFVMAVVFFLSGQAKIQGPSVPIRLNIPEMAYLDFSVTLPAQIRDSTFQLFESQYAGLPIAPPVAAYLFSYAEFVLPICVLIGFGTRFAALALLILTMLLQVYGLAAMWWSTHVYWVSILMVLVSIGPGAISIDALISYVYRHDRQAAVR